MQGEPNTVGGHELLAKMAASVAGGIEANPDVSDLSAEDVAERAVAIAEAIINRLTMRGAS